MLLNISWYYSTLSYNVYSKQESPLFSKVPIVASHFAMFPDGPTNCSNHCK